MNDIPPISSNIPPQIPLPPGPTRPPRPTCPTLGEDPAERVPITNPVAAIEAILRQPRATVLKPPAAPGRAVVETRAQHLVSRVLTLEQCCREVAALLAGTPLDQVAGHEVQRLRHGCAQALLSLDYARDVLQRQATGGVP